MRSRLPKRRVSHLRKERMSSYEEMARERKRARVLFLELRAEGFELLAQQSPEDPVGYVVGVEGPACSKRLLERIKANKPGLLKILLHRWDPDLEAIQREGAV
jgi:hypothetical protein